MTSRLAAAVADILEANGHIWPTIDKKRPATLEIRRTRAGRADREAGAWSWFLFCADIQLMDIGSQWPAGQIARLGSSGVDVSRNRFGQISINPSSDSIKKALEAPQTKRAGAARCPRCGRRGALLSAQATCNGGTLRNDSLWQGQALCARCIKTESWDATSAGEGDGRKVPGLLIFEMAGLGLVESYNPPVLSETVRAAQRGYEFTPASPPPSVR